MMVSLSDFAYLVGLKRNPGTGNFHPWVYVIEEKEVAERYAGKITLDLAAAGGKLKYLTHFKEK